MLAHGQFSYVAHGLLASMGFWRAAGDIWSRYGADDCHCLCDCTEL